MMCVVKLSNNNNGAQTQSAKQVDQSEHTRVDNPILLYEGGLKNFDPKTFLHSKKILFSTSSLFKLTNSVQ